MSKHAPKSKFAKQTTSGSRASRLNLYISHQSNHFLGNVSLIKVNIKIIGQIVNVIPLEDDTFQALKERALASVKKNFEYSINGEAEENFTFFWGKNSLTKAEEESELEKVVQDHYASMDQYFEGDILSISLLLTDTAIEYEFLRENLSSLKTPSVNVLFLVKQHSQKKKLLKNRLLKIEENTDCWLVTIYSAKGDLKEAFHIHSLKTEKNEPLKYENSVYFPLILKKQEQENEEDFMSQEGESYDALVLFTQEEEIVEFIGDLEKLQQSRSNRLETFNEELILESIEELGRRDTENFDEGVEVGRIDSIDPKTFQKSCMINCEMYSMFTPINSKKSPNFFIEKKELNTNDTIFPMMTTEPAVTMRFKHNDSGQYENSYYFDPESRPLTKSKLVSSKTITGINKAILQKKELNLNSQEFEIKIKGLFGIKQSRIMRISEDFELLFFKKEKEKYIFVNSILISNIIKITPKSPDSNAAYLFVKSEKKQQRPLKIIFKDNDEIARFFKLSRRIAELFNNSANSFQTEKEKQNNQKLYPWLISPVDLSVTQHQNETARGQTTLAINNNIQFKVINLSEAQEPEIAHIDLLSAILSFKTIERTVKRKFNIRDILFCEINFKDPRALTLILKNKKYKLLFSDNKNRLFFETAIYNTILSKYKIPSKQLYEWQPVKVFCTTFNTGFGKPPVDLSMWLGKAQDSDIIALGLQEADTADWIQAFYQDELIKTKYTVVTVVTMWKMLIFVAVKTKYANFVTNVEVQSKATGIAKLIGNKGGVAVSFRFLESGFCFLSCHLAAGPGQDKMQTRKADFYNLLKSIRMGDDDFDLCMMYDYFFFMGDTNYRLDYDFFKAVEIIEQNEYLSLIMYDQYRKAKEGDGFMNIFKEGQIKFKPTYRRNRDNDGYSNKKNQAPSWTDRIFVKSRPGHPTTFHEYNSVEMFFLSDHRPVYLLCECEVQPPYLPRIPIYSRPSEQFGIIKFSDIKLDYNFALAEKMEEFIDSLTPPLSASIGFRAKFLLKAATTVPLQIKEIPNKEDIIWTQEMMPFLYCIIPDYRFLRSENLLVIIKVSNQENPSPNEIIIGQAEISLDTLILNKGTKTQFKSDVFLYGKQFGKLTGQIMYVLSQQ